MARLLPSSTLSAGTVIPFHVAVNTNNMEIYVGQIDLTVTDTPTATAVVRRNHLDEYYRKDCYIFFILFYSFFFCYEKNKYYMQCKLFYFIFVLQTTSIVNTSLLYINSSSDPHPVNVGNLTTLPIAMYVPPNTMSSVLFDIELPQLTVTIGTIENIRVSSSGSNIGCVYENESLALNFDRKFNSSINTCQIHHGQLDLGTVTNTGIIKQLVVSNFGIRLVG